MRVRVVFPFSQKKVTDVGGLSLSCACRMGEANPSLISVISFRNKMCWEIELLWKYQM